MGKTLGAIVLSLLLLPNVGHALTMTIEAGRDAAYPGAHPDFYNVVFVTLGTRAPIFEYNPGANAIERAAWQLTFDAFSVGLVPGWDFIETSWRPFMSMTGINAVDHIAGPLFNTQGELVSPDANTFFHGGANSLTNPINYTADGVLMPSGTPVMSGTINGSGSGDDCQDWEDGSGSYTGVSYSTTTLYDNSGGDCGQSGLIIGISAPIPWPQSMAPVPEPSTVVLGGIGFMTLFGFAYRKMMKRYEV